MPVTDEIAARITDAVDDLAADAIALTQALVACRTDSQSIGNAEFEPEAIRCQDVIAAQLAAIGFDVQRWTEPPRYPVVAGVKRGSGGGKSVAINGHVDVVPVGDTSA